MEVTKEALRIASRSSDLPLISDGKFWMLAEQKNNPPVRNRAEQTGTILKAKYIAPNEFRAAAKLIVEQSGHVEMDELVKAVGNLLGFKRVGPDLQDGISRALKVKINILKWRNNCHDNL